MSEALSSDFRNRVLIAKGAIQGQLESDRRTQTAAEAAQLLADHEEQLARESLRQLLQTAKAVANLALDGSVAAPEGFHIQKRVGVYTRKPSLSGWVLNAATRPMGSARQETAHSSRPGLALAVDDGRLFEYTLHMEGFTPIQLVADPTGINEATSFPNTDFLNRFIDGAKAGLAIFSANNNLV